MIGIFVRLVLGLFIGFSIANLIRLQRVRKLILSLKVKDTPPLPAVGETITREELTKLLEDLFFKKGQINILEKLNYFFF